MAFAEDPTDDLIPVLSFGTPAHGAETWHHLFGTAERPRRAQRGGQGHLLLLLRCHVLVRCPATGRDTSHSWRMARTPSPDLLLGDGA